MALMFSFVLRRLIMYIGVVMSPEPKGYGMYCCWCVSRRRPRRRSFLSATYRLNQLVDFDQTGTDTLLGRGKKVLGFGDLDLVFMVTPSL